MKTSDRNELISALAATRRTSERQAILKQLYHLDSE